MTTQPTPPRSLPEIVAKNRERVAYGLIGAGVIFLALAIFWAIRWNSGRDQPPPPPEPAAQEITAEPRPIKPAGYGDYMPAAIWAGLLALMGITSGGWHLTRKPADADYVHDTRVWLITVGACTGFATAVLGFALAWRWQSSLLLWINEGETQEAKWVLAALAIFLAGLALAFFSVQLARAEERTNVVLRRTLYGTNAAVTGLLLLLVLAVVNVVAFAKLPDNVITTASAFKGLSDPSKEFLKTVNEDAHVYLILPENHAVPIRDPENPGAQRAYNGLYTDCLALMNACHAENPHIKVKALSPATDDDEIKALVKRLKLPEEQRRIGLVVTYGPDESLSAFIPARELVLLTERGPLFQGENRLMTELNFLAGGAQKPVVYFTQSNGEPSIGGTSEPSLRTANDVVEHLKARKYEVRPLRFEPGRKPDLNDATMVVVAAPRVPFTAEQAEILGQYLKPAKGGGMGGKLVAFLPAFPDATGAVSPTGLEDLLFTYGVKVESRKRLFSMPRPELRPEFVPGTTFDEEREFDHPLARLLGRDQAVPFGNVRPVSAEINRLPPDLGAFNLFTTRNGWFTYQDRDYNSDPKAVEAQVRKDPRGTIGDKSITNQAVPFGVFVAERVREGGETQATERPRLLVIGTDAFVGDDALRQSRAPHVYIAMTGAMLDYVRERPRGMNIEPKALGTFALKKDSDSVSVLFLPIALVVLGITALGAGVWVARRK